MSILPLRRLLNAILVLSFLMPLISFSQVTIKEKVEIVPRVKLPSNAAVELKITFRWAAENSASNHMMRLGVLEPGSVYKGFDPYTGLATGNYKEVITEVSESMYIGEATYINSNPQSGGYYLYGFHDLETIWINYMYYYSMHIEAAGIVDTVIYLKKGDWTRMYELPYVVNYIVFTFFGPPPPPCGGAHFEFLEIQDVQHGETRTLHAPILNDCGANVYPPPESYYKYELLGDTLSWGVLRDPNTGRMGTVLDSVASTIVEYCAWGKEPDCQKELTVRASAENGSITPATTTFTVLPPEARLILGKSTLSFGDTTLATVEVRYPGSEWMERPYDWRTNFGIVQADTFGHLYLIDSSQTGSYINAWESNVIYYAHPQTETDSVDVLIQVVSHEPSGGGDTRIELVDHPNTNSLQLERATKAPQPKVVAGTGKGNPGLTSIRYNYTTHYGLARLKLMKVTVCVQVDVAPSLLSPGDTASLTFKTADGADFPAGQEFDVMIVGGGGSSGTLQSLSGNGTVLTKTRAPVSYVAPSAIEGTITVQVAAFANGSGSGGNATVTLEKAVTSLKRAPGQVTAKSMVLNSDRAVLDRIGKLLANSECQAAQVVVEPQRYPPCVDQVDYTQVTSATEAEGPPEYSRCIEGVDRGGTFVHFWGNVGRPIEIAVCDAGGTCIRARIASVRAFIEWGYCKNILTSLGIAVDSYLSFIPKGNTTAARRVVDSLIVQIEGLDEIISEYEAAEKLTDFIGDKGGRTNGFYSLQGILDHERAHRDLAYGRIERAVKEVSKANTECIPNPTSSEIESRLRSMTTQFIDMDELLRKASRNSAELAGHRAEREHLDKLAKSIKKEYGLS